MTTPFVVLDLDKQAPHSPRERLAGFAIAIRAVDKCLASLVGKLGQFHYDCPLDNSLFSFKGITGKQFKGAVRTLKNYEEIGIWLRANGTPKTTDEIQAWSDEMEAASLEALQKNWLVRKYVNKTNPAPMVPKYKFEPFPQSQKITNEPRLLRR